MAPLNLFYTADSDSQLFYIALNESDRLTAEWQSDSNEETQTADAPMLMQSWFVYCLHTLWELEDTSLVSAKLFWTT